MRKLARPQSQRVISKRPPLVRRSPSEKAKLLELLDREFVAGATVEQIAKKYNISTASYYRWQRQRNGHERTSIAKSNVNIIPFENAIRLLCQKEPTSSISLVNAILQLITWIRWPSENDLHAIALVNCYASYLTQMKKYSSMQELDIEEANLLQAYLPLDLIISLSSPTAILNPSFEIITNGKSRYDDRQFYAQIVNYLLSDQIMVGRKPHRPSIGRLELLISQKAFGREWSMSARTFNKHWRLRAASSPFLYVEQYHSSLDWSLNPLDDDFACSVNDVVELKSSMLDYFGKVKWVIMQLKHTLDPRAVRHITFPQMPDYLEPVPVKNPPIDAHLQEKIAAVF